MLKSSLNKKILSGILVTVMIALNFSFIAIPKKAEAIPVAVFANAWQTAYDDAWAALSKLEKIAAQTLVIHLAMDIANWISNGFQGNPSFLNDPTRFAKNVADVAIGEFIYEDPSLNFLCKPFQLQLKLSLALQHRKFYQTINCTLSGVLQNGKDAYNNFASGDFINGGSWDTFLTLVTDPNATPEGAFLVMDSELTARIQNKQGTVDKELAQGQGSLSFRSCTETTYGVDKDSTGALTKTETSQTTYPGSPFYDQSTTTTSNANEDGYSGTSIETTCKITSPGTLIAERLWFGQTAGQRMTEMQAVMGQAIDIIASALANYAIDQLMGAVLQSSSGDQQYANLDTMITQLQNQQQTTPPNNPNNPNNPDNPQTNAAALLQNQIGYEITYYNIQNSILNYVNGSGNSSIRGILNWAIGCNNSSSDSLGPTRAEAIRTKVLAANGTIDSQLGNITSLNVSNINTNISTASSSISTLTSRLNSLGSNDTTQVVQSWINSHTPPFHTASQAVSTSSAMTPYNWAKTEIENYSTSTCTFTIPVFSN